MKSKRLTEAQKRDRRETARIACANIAKLPWRQSLEELRRFEEDHSEIADRVEEYEERKRRRIAEQNEF
jgi:hypothetical protein